MVSIVDFTNVVQPFSIPKKFRIPLNPLDAFCCWGSWGIPKRRDLLDHCTKQRERVIVDRIGVSLGDKPLVKVAQFSTCFNLADSDDLKVFKSILLKIDLKKIDFITSEYSDYFRRVSTSFAELRLHRKRYAHSEVHHITNFSKKTEIDDVVNHLNNGEIYENDESDVELFIEHGFNLRKESPSYQELVDVHNKANAWGRALQEEITEESFSNQLRKCIDDICSSCGFLDDDICDELANEALVIAHALCQSQEIKLAQRVKNSDEKRELAFKLWQESYKNKTQKERKALGVSQRSLAERVGVSVGTLNGWIKEFERGDQ